MIHMDKFNFSSSYFDRYSRYVTITLPLRNFKLKTNNNLTVETLNNNV